ncbi:hypothetical protein MNBD_GAMMA18-416 [hydrothermal vent metagenome]|uniref:DUF4136 domain-containing protein n=1 Tax=hydrothermal vent metagenome TaxID=652676 RepID=A0A3B0Z4W9_9ZZZZ
MRQKTLLLALVLLLSGCSQSTINIKLDAINTPDYSAEKQSYQLLSGDPETKRDDLYFKEFSRLARYALKQTGLQATRDAASANQKVYFSFGVNSGTTQRQTYSTPIYEYVGGDTITIKENAIRNGNTESSTTQLYIPYRLQLVGRESRSRKITTYLSYLRLEGRSNDDEQKQLWMITVETNSGSNDLRMLIPLMLSKAQPYIGKNSGRAIYIKTSADDQQVQQFIDGANN